MGVVYLAWDPRLKRRVALKTLRPELVRDDQARKRFLREARAVAAVSHPNVTQIYDIGEDAGSIYFAMEYLDGKSLQEELKEGGPLEIRRVLSLARQTVKGLQAAAEQGIIHRDVKPSNLVLNGDGTLKVTDFGLAKHSVADSDLTSSTVFIGTADYLSPERASGEAVDMRSDIYSLGATLYELLTGRKPFEGATPLIVITKHLREVVRPPRELRPDLPYPVQFLLLHMMAKRRENRPQNYEVLLSLLERLDEIEPLQVAEAPEPPPSEQVPQARSWGMRVVGGVAVALLAVLFWSAMSRESASRPDAAPAPGVDAPPPLNAAQNTSPSSAPGTARKAELNVVRNGSELTEEGRLRVYGEVENIGPVPAVQGRVRVALVDRLGNEVSFIEVPLSPPTLAPGAMGSFEAVLPGEAEEGMIKLELSWVS